MERVSYLVAEDAAAREVFRNRREVRGSRKWLACHLASTTVAPGHTGQPHGGARSTLGVHCGYKSSYFCLFRLPLRAGTG